MLISDVVSSYFFIALTEEVLLVTSKIFGPRVSCLSLQQTQNGQYNHNNHKLAQITCFMSIQDDQKIVSSRRKWYYHKTQSKNFCEDHKSTNHRSHNIEIFVIFVASTNFLFVADF
jgi:hypothetical protein